MCTHGLSVRTHTQVCVCTLRVSCGLSFQKISYSSKNKLYFPRTLSSSQFSSDLALNQLWALEYYHHWGTGAQVIKDTKCGVYKMLPPKAIKDVQKLTRRVVALNKFVSEAMEKCLPFFKTLKQAFAWMDDYEVAF